MTIDLSQYMDASFRGVKFHCNKATLNFSHRVDVKNFPFNDKPHVTDMGLSGDKFDLEIYMLGDDFIAQRQALEKALKITGPGLLIHPTRGEITAQVETVRHGESYNDNLCIADYTITFIVTDINNNPMPVVLVDTQDAVITSSVFVEEIAVDTFSHNGFENFTDPQIFDSFQDDFISYADVIGNASSMLSGATPENILSGIDSFIAVQSNISNITDNFNISRAIINQAVSVANQWYSFSDSTRAFNSLSSMLGLGGINAIINGGFGASLDRLFTRKSSSQYGYISPSLGGVNSANKQTLASVFDLGMLTTAAKLSTKAKFDSLPQAIAARDLLASIIDQAATKEFEQTPPKAVADFRNSLRSLKVAVYRDLTDRASSLPKLHNHNPQAVLPARTLAYRLGEDVNKMTKRNDIIHPSFVPSNQVIFYQKGVNDG